MFSLITGIVHAVQLKEKKCEQIQECRKPDKYSHGLTCPVIHF